MSEDNGNAQVAPENEALKQIGDNEASAEENQTSAETAGSTPPVEEEKVVLTKQEFDNRAAKIKAIAERKAKREGDARVKAEIEKIQAQSVASAPQTNQAQQQPSVDHIWDNLLGWIHKDTTDAQKYAEVTQALMAQSNQNQGAPAVSQPQLTPQPQSNLLPEDNALKIKAADQIDECDIEFDDFAGVARACFTDAMIIAAAREPNGVRNLFEEAKEDPMKFYKIQKLSPDEQKFKVVEMQMERAKAPTKVVTSATPQPDPLETNGSTGYADMSLADRRKADMKKSWG